MTDTANPGNLASSPLLAGPEEFDARLKRTDENRWLATRYAPGPERERLVALYCLHHELQRALSASDPMLGKIRIQWWRETIEGIACGGPVRRHDLSLELARVLAGRADLLPALYGLVDAFDDAIDDHLHGTDHQPGGAHEARHFAAEAAITRLCGLTLEPAATAAQLDALSRCGEAGLAVAASLPDAPARIDTARRAARGLPSLLWPAIGHLAAASDETALGKRWRVLKAMLTRRF